MSEYCDEQYAVYDERYRRARKTHGCDACERVIRRGDRYAYITTIFDGNVDHIVRCGACQTTHLHLRELCRGRSRTENGWYTSGEGYWPDETLSCGLKYEDEWGEMPEEIQRLAFVADDEVGRLLK